MKVKLLSRVQLSATAWTLCPWDFPGKSTAVGCHFLLQGIFPTQGLNPGLPHSGHALPSKPPGKPIIIANTDIIINNRCKFVLKLQFLKTKFSYQDEKAIYEFSVYYQENEVKLNGIETCKISCMK